MRREKPRAYFVNFQGIPSFWYIDSKEEGLDREEDCVQVRNPKKVEEFIFSDKGKALRAMIERL